MRKRILLILIAFSLFAVNIFAQTSQESYSTKGIFTTDVDKSGSLFYYKDTGFNDFLLFADVYSTTGEFSYAGKKDGYYWNVFLNGSFFNFSKDSTLTTDEVTKDESLEETSKFIPGHWSPLNLNLLFGTEDFALKGEFEFYPNLKKSLESKAGYESNSVTDYGYFNGKLYANAFNYSNESLTVKPYAAVTFSASFDNLNKLSKGGATNIYEEKNYKKDYSSLGGVLGAQIDLAEKNDVTQSFNLNLLGGGKVNPNVVSKTTEVSATHDITEKTESYEMPYGKVDFAGSYLVNYKVSEKLTLGAKINVPVDLEIYEYNHKTVTTVVNGSESVYYSSTEDIYNYTDDTDKYSDTTYLYMHVYPKVSGALQYAPIDTVKLYFKATFSACNFALNKYDTETFDTTGKNIKSKTKSDWSNSWCSFDNMTLAASWSLTENFDITGGIYIYNANPKIWSGSDSILDSNIMLGLTYRK